MRHRIGLAASRSGRVRMRPAVCRFKNRGGHGSWHHLHLGVSVWLILPLILGLVTPLAPLVAAQPGSPLPAPMPVHPGDAAFRLVATNDVDRSLGASGESNGTDLFPSMPTGAVTTVMGQDTRRNTTLDVDAVDATGAPRPGSCFALIDQEGRQLTQACDADDE